MLTSPSLLKVASASVFSCRKRAVSVLSCSTRLSVLVIFLRAGVPAKARQRQSPTRLFFLVVLRRCHCRLSQCPGQDRVSPRARKPFASPIAWLFLKLLLTQIGRA